MKLQRLTMDDMFPATKKFANLARAISLEAAFQDKFASRGVTLREMYVFLDFSHQPRSYGLQECETIERMLNRLEA